MRVKVYRNLHRDAWSIMAAEGPQKGRVVGYADAVAMINPELRVGQASRERAVREQSRNVHAFVVGELIEMDAIANPVYRVRYNPFRASCFHTTLGTCVFSGGFALLDRQGGLWMDVSPDRELVLGELRARAPSLTDTEWQKFYLQHRETFEEYIERTLGRLEQQP